MATVETRLKTGQDFLSDFVSKVIDGMAISVSQSSTRDPETKALTEQMIVAADGEVILRRTFRMDSEGNSTAVLDYGERFGGGQQMLLNMTAAPKDGQMVVSGGGEINGRALAPFSDTFQNRDGVSKRMLKSAGAKDDLAFADGSALPGMKVDPKLAAALEKFAAGLDSNDAAMKVSRSTACIAGCTAATAACALACAGLAGPGFALCGKGCVAAQTACIAYCAT